MLSKLTVDWLSSEDSSQLLKALEGLTEMDLIEFRERIVREIVKGVGELK